MKRVGDLGMPVSDSYSLELSVSNCRKGFEVTALTKGLLHIFIRRFEPIFVLNLFASSKKLVDFEKLLSFLCDELNGFGRECLEKVQCTDVCDFFF